jgi:hypothetical protein
LAPPKKLPDSEVSSEPEGCDAAPAQLFGSLMHAAFAFG